MVFIKNGDSMPVEGFYVGDTSQEEMCAQCGKPLVVIAVTGNNNSLVCQICDLDEDLDAE